MAAAERRKILAPYLIGRDFTLKPDGYILAQRKKYLLSNYKIALLKFQYLDVMLSIWKATQ